jgi:hypothetical protein
VKEAYTTGLKSLPEIIAETGIARPTVYGWRNADEKAWDKLLDLHKQEQRYLVDKYKDLEAVGDDFEKIHTLNLLDASKATAIALIKLKKLLLAENPLPLLGEIQKASNALDKQGAAFYKHENKGVDKKETNHKMTIDMDDVYALIDTFKKKGVEITWEEATNILQFPAQKKAN